MLNVPGNYCMSSQMIESCLATFISDSSCFVSVYVCGFILLAFFPSEKCRFLISLIWFLHIRSCYKFQIRLQQNQISFLFLNRTALMSGPGTLKNHILQNLSTLGVQEEPSTQYWMHHPRNFISRRLSIVSKQWIKPIA